MNENHMRLCSSPEWAERIQTELLPSLVRDVDLGEVMLEVGPGPGAATVWLRRRVRHLVALELDAEAASLLECNLAGANVEVVVGDASEMQFPDASFDSVGSFTMLHHVTTAAAQHKVLSEIFRVLRPGGVLIASDSLASTELHHFHVDDTYNPIEPSFLLVLLRALGFSKITLAVDRALSVVAFKPASANDTEFAA
jgi:ubiquinone/menaquinone biosynthesis C-methylase UbiE